MWLVALGRLVLLFARPLLLMVLLVSFGARPLRHLSANRPPHYSTHLVPPVAVEVPQRPVAPLVLHAPESLSYLNLVSCTWRQSSHTSHQKTSNASPGNVAVACHRPPQPHSIYPLGSKLHVRSWISPEQRPLQTAKSHFGSSSGTVDSTLSGHPRLVEKRSHTQAATRYFHIIPRFQTLHDRSRHALNSSVGLFHPAA